MEKLGQMLKQATYSVYELVHTLWNKTNDVIENLNKKIENGQDFKGSWWGIEKPVYSEPGIAGVVNQHDLRLDEAEKKLGFNAYSPEDFILPSEETYTNAFSRIMTLINTKGYGSVVLTPHKTYEGNLIINTSNVRVVGSGILKGTIKIEGQRFENENERYFGTNNVVIEGITIDGNEIFDGITMQYVFGVTITNVTFKNCIKSIKVNTINYFQHVSRVKITNNLFHNCTYSLFLDKQGGDRFIAGDITFSDNTHDSTFGALTDTIYSVFVNGLDGLVCNGNTLFGSSRIVSNIKIQNCQWVIISNNQMFVPLEHCIHIIASKQITISGNNLAWSTKDGMLLDGCIQFSITGNNITWYSYTGRSFIASGIAIINQDNCYGIISGNSILFPYINGIRTNNAGKLSITGNTITNLESPYEPIYINGSSYCVLTNNTCLSFNIPNKMNGYNHVETGTYTGDRNIIDNTMKKLAVTVYNGNETTINIDNVSAIVLANPSATTINSIICSDLNYPRIVYVYSYNANTSISRAIGNTQFSGSAGKINIGSLGCLTLMVFGGKILDISRNNCTEI